MSSSTVNFVSNSVYDQFHITSGLFDLVYVKFTLFILVTTSCCKGAA
jgi:hypothetical protein